MSERVETWQQVAEGLRRERDALRAQVEAVRALAEHHRDQSERSHELAEAYDGLRGHEEHVERLRERAAALRDRASEIEAALSSSEPVTAGPECRGCAAGRGWQHTCAAGEVTPPAEQQADAQHDEFCAEWCNHCTVCGTGIMWGSRCHDHPNRPARPTAEDGA